MNLRGLLQACALLLFGCRTPRDREPEAAAVIVNRTAESRAALAQAVSAALNGRTVMLADDALTESAWLIIERIPRRDESGVRLDGRERGMPERFQLVKSGGRCVLVHERTGARAALESTECAEAP